MNEDDRNIDRRRNQFILPFVRFYWVIWDIETKIHKLLLKRSTSCYRICHWLNFQCATIIQLYLALYPKFESLSFNFPIKDPFQSFCFMSQYIMYLIAIESPVSNPALMSRDFLNRIHRWWKLAPILKWYQSHVCTCENMWDYCNCHSDYGS
jgi:hypothetical protein